MKAYLINPGDRTVSQIDTDGSLEEFYKLLGCQTVERVRLTATVDLWIDDEGHLTSGTPIFTIHEMSAIFAGRGVVLGHDEEGNSAEPDIPLEAIARHVRWTELESSGDFTEGRVEGNTIFGGSPLPQLRGSDRFLVWSHEHGGWWAPAARGYVVSLAKAGRYTREQAIKICLNARGGWREGRAPNEIMVSEFDAIAAGLDSPMA